MVLPLFELVVQGAVEVCVVCIAVPVVLTAVVVSFAGYYAASALSAMR